MKIKVINNKLPNFDEELKVTKLNYDMVVAVKGEEKLHFCKADVQIIPENKHEDILIKYKDILKIKLNRGISQEFYIILIQYIEDRVNEEIRSINLLQDDFRIIKKGFWEKRMLLVINEEVPLDISVTAGNYSNIFNFTVREITLRDFVAECAFQVESIEKEIRESQRKIDAYREAVKDVLTNYKKSKDPLLILNSNREKIAANIM